MSIAEKIKKFHQSLNYKLTPLPITSLTDHSITVISPYQENKTQLKIRAFHFTLLSAKRRVTMTAPHDKSSIKWEEINQNYELYYEKELQQFGLQCLYLASLPLAECTVQRHEKNKLAVIDIRPLTIDELTLAERNRLIGVLDRVSNHAQITFGCDIELMLKNYSTMKFVSADTLVKNSQIGFDDAIALHKHRVFHPILEVRSKPALTMNRLYDDLVYLHKKLVNESSKYQLDVITEANPYHRFYLGGHIHFGNVPITFQHVRVLDQFVAIPFSLVETNPSFNRRRSYGRLGSVRENRFQGFEYRVLPSWFHLIPNSLPLLQWVEFLIKNATKLPTSSFHSTNLRSYYERNDQLLNEWIDVNKKYFLKEKEGKFLFEQYILFLKKNIEIVEPPK